jgi:hypothetical protein
MQRILSIIGFVVGIAMPLFWLIAIANIDYNRTQASTGGPMLTFDGLLILNLPCAVLVVTSLISGSSKSPRVWWILYVLAAGMGLALISLVSGGISQGAFYGVAVLVGLVGIFSPLQERTNSVIAERDTLHTSAVVEIERLDGLLKRGLIDQAEFQQLKSKILQRSK